MLKIKINLTNPAHVSAAAAFFFELNSIEGANKDVLIKGTVEETLKPKAEAPKAEAPKAEAPKAEAPKAEAVETKPVETKPVETKPVEVSMPMLRELTTAITKHENVDKKKAAKQWLKDNGFNNVPGITTDKYQDCFDAFTKILNG